VAKGDALYKRTVESWTKIWKVTDFYLEWPYKWRGITITKICSTKEKNTFTWYHIMDELDQQYAYEMKKKMENTFEYYFNGKGI